MTDYSQKKPYDGLLDQHADVRLRIGRVDNPTIMRKEGSDIEPLNTVGIVNLQTGQICVTWIDGQGKGGIVRSSQFSGENDYKTNQIDGHGTIVTDYTLDSSEQQMLTLSHAMMWANDKNWCGMHYLPPVGSIVVVGFRKNNMPVLLGYLQSNYSQCSPIKAGELMMKGYGNNHIHWQQSDKLELKAWSTKDSADLSDLNSGRRNDSNCDVYVVLNGNDKSVKFRVRDRNRNDGKSYDSFLKMEPDKIYMEVVSDNGTSNINMTDSNVTINTGSFTVNAPNGIHLN